MTRAATRAPATGETGKVVGWGLVFYGGVQLVGYLLANNDVGAAAVQAALSEWGAGRVGVAWSDPLAKVPSWTGIARRAASGGALGFVAGVACLVALLVTHGATVVKGSVTVPLLAVDLLVVALSAVRDELLLRGFVLRALGGWPSPAAAALVCGVASAAARLGVPGSVPVEVAIAGVSGVAFAALWQRDRGAWMAVGANAAFAFTTGPLLHYASLEVTFNPTLWGGGDKEAAGSATVLAVVVLLSLGALAWSARTTPTES